MIIIKSHFEYQPHIVPACLQFVEAEKYPRSRTYALVASWGLNKVGLLDFLKDSL